MKIEGYYGAKPLIKRMSFSKKGIFDLHLEDGRVISVSNSKIPDIKKLTLKQKTKGWSIISGEGFTFDDCNEVYHIEQILGKYEDYKYEFVSEPRTQYKSKNNKTIK